MPVWVPMPEFRDDSLIKLFAESYGALRPLRAAPGALAGDRRRIVQEPSCALRAWQERPAPKPFLYSIARNLATDHHRHGRVARMVGLGDPDRSTYYPGSRRRKRASCPMSRHGCCGCIALAAATAGGIHSQVFHACSYKELRSPRHLDKTVENHIAHALHDTHAYMRRRRS